MKRVALMVGVDQYKDEAFRDLRYSVADAAALAAAFGRLGFETHVATNPETQALLKEVRRWTTGLGAGDVFLFFFAGHGYTGPGGEHLLICSDDSREFLRHNRAGVPVDMLEELTNGKGYHRAFLLDACRTDVFSGQEMRGSATRDLGLVAMPDARGNPGTCCVMRSCDRFCPALEFEDLGHGVFTRAVLDFLEGPSGLAVQMGEAFAAGVRERMRSILKREGSLTEQNPTFQTNGAAFPLFEGGGVAAPVAEPPKAVTVEQPLPDPVGIVASGDSRTDGEVCDPFLQKVQLERELQVAGKEKSTENERRALDAIRKLWAKGDEALRAGQDVVAEMRFSEAERAMKAWQETAEKRGDAIFQMKRLKGKLGEAGKEEESTEQEQKALAAIRDLHSAGAAAVQTERYDDAKKLFSETEKALEKWKEEKAKRQTDEHAEELLQWGEEKWRMKWVFVVGTVLALFPILLFILLNHGFDTAFKQTRVVWPWCWWHLKFGMVVGIGSIGLFFVSDQLYPSAKRKSISKKVYANKVETRVGAFVMCNIGLAAVLLLCSIFNTFDTLGFSIRAFGTSIFFVIEYAIYCLFGMSVYLFFNASLWNINPLDTTGR